MNNELRTTLILPPDLAQRLDDYWHTRRLNTRNEAIRQLLTYALNHEQIHALHPDAAKPAKETRR
jgi:metal-responsive CopG/Arc/MetJ family transcriptional regulator